MAAALALAEALDVAAREAARGPRIAPNSIVTPKPKTLFGKIRANLLQEFSCGFSSYNAEGYILFLDVMFFDEDCLII